MLKRPRQCMPCLFLHWVRLEELAAHRLSRQGASAVRFHQTLSVNGPVPTLAMEPDRRAPERLCRLGGP